ncbi:MAG: fatty acid desaturase family protein [Pseudomonadota bacterium]|nr:fatty acid desaturase family protein [Pseudomonadota bacterium]
MDTSQITGGQFLENESNIGGSISAYHVAREKLTELSRINDRVALLSLLETLAVLIIPILLCWYLNHPMTTLLTLVFVGTRQHSLFVLVHEATHFRLFSNRALNDGMGRVLGAIICISFQRYRDLHFKHHSHLYQKEDPDLPLQSGYPKGFLHLFKKLSQDLSGITCLKTYAYFWRISVNIPLDSSLSGSSLQRGRNQDLALTTLLYTTVGTTAFINELALLFLLCWIVPLLTIVPAILRLRAICEHGAVSNTISPLSCSRTNIGSKFLLWTLFPHNVNYHLEHHLYPSIPQYNLPKLHQALSKVKRMKGAEYRDIGTTLRLIFARP